MERLSGNRRLVYEQLRRLGGGRVSLGTLACGVGCSRQTVWRAVQEITARGLIYYEPGRGRPSLYKICQ